MVFEDPADRSPSESSGSRLLVVPYTTPVESSGTSIVLRRLLENFASDEVVVLGRAPDRKSRLTSRTLHCPIIQVPSLPKGIRGDRYWRIASTIPALLAGCWAVRRYHPTAILAVFPDESSLLIGYYLHLLTRLPLLAYFCDLYLEDVRRGWEKLLARWLQPRVLRSASKVAVVNEGLASFYQSKYGIEPLCLPTCINAAIPEFSPMPAPARPFVVGYSGNVNATRLSSLRALVRAIGDDPYYSIKYFTPQRLEFLVENGLWAGNATATFVSDEADLVRQLSSCDALFLPLAFETDSNSYEQLATCFGIKSYEYFLAQRPVLLHCPRDYFIARFYKTWSCGLLVEDPEPEALREGLRLLRTDGSLRESLVRNALQVATQFLGPRVATTLREALREVARGPAVSRS